MKSCRRKTMLTILLFHVLFLFGGCGSPTVKMSETSTAMGTVVQSSIYVKDTEAGEEVLTGINEYLKQNDEEILSWRAEGSQIASINATAGDLQGYELPSWTGLENALHTIWEISEKSGGALDVTIGPVTQAWNLDYWAVEGAEDFEIPATEQLEMLLQNTGYEKVKLEGNKVILPAQMKLDLGAVGKGLVCDKIGEYLAGQELVEAAIITVGGSVLTYGEKPEGGTWNVAIVHPREENSYLGTLALSGTCYIATSGDYERFVEWQGKRYHHIIDPDTGYPADSGVCSVTIVSESGLLSDALSTACFVLGTEKGLNLAEEYGVQALFVTEDLEIIMTEGMTELFVPSK